jgi:5'-3' exonuclease
MQDAIMLIDGMNMLWRANMSWGKDKKDESSNYVMIYNFFRNLRPLVEKFSPHKIFFVLEGHPKHRYEIYSEYKANRIVKTASKQEEKNNFFETAKLAIDLLQYLPITTCRAENYEADDVIATLSENLKDEKIVIISNDSDYIQLLQRGYKDINLYNPVKKTFLDSPEYFYLAWKCLRGDSADHIPGLMSDAKAEKLVKNPNLLQQWMSVEENRANFTINKKLIEFAQVPEEDITINDGKANFISLREEFIKMDFQSLLKPDSWQKFCYTFNCIKF